MGRYSALEGRTVRTRYFIVEHAKLTVRIDCPSCDDMPLACNDFCVDTDNHTRSDPFHDIGVATLADPSDVPFVDTDISLQNPRSASNSRSGSAAHTL